jgi:pyruvate carboxylase
LRPQGWLLRILFKESFMNDTLFRFDNAAVVFIDYQPEMLAAVQSMDQKLMMVNARSLAASRSRWGCRSS